MRRKTQLNDLTIQRFVKHYGSRFRGLIGRQPWEPSWTEAEARRFFAKHERKIRAEIEGRGYGHEALEKWLREAPPAMLDYEKQPQKGNEA